MQHRHWARVRKHELHLALQAGHTIHFLHIVRTAEDLAGAQGVPLLLLHGWPGSVVEFLDLIDRPEMKRFHLVVPSLPGLKLECLEHAAQMHSGLVFIVCCLLSARLRLVRSAQATRC